MLDIATRAWIRDQFRSPSSGIREDISWLQLQELIVTRVNGNAPLKRVNVAGTWDPAQVWRPQDWGDSWLPEDED